MRIVDLRCEYIPAQVERRYAGPCCIDRERPCFSFAVDGEGGDTAVKYYKILVSSSEQFLLDGNGDMWDSGLIYSSDTRFTEYAGRPLYDMTTYYFRAFAMVGRTALKSRIGSFNTGMIHDSLWRCGFIGSPEDNCRDLYFNREINVKKAVRHAYAYAAATGACELFVNGESAGRTAQGTGYESFRYTFFDLTALLTQGNNRVCAAVSGGPERRTGFIMHIDIEYEDGSASAVVTNGTWRASLSPDSDGVCAEAFCPAELIGAKPKAAPRRDADGLPPYAPESFALCRDLSNAAYYSASVYDLFDLQRPDGSLPAYGRFSGGAYGHGAAVLAFAYKYYMNFADRRVLDDNFGAMRKLYAHLKNVSGVSLPSDQDAPYGDALELAYFACCAHYMKLISEAVGNGGTAEQYKKEFDSICASLYEALITKDGPEGQRDFECYALCLVYGLCGAPAVSAEKFADAVEAAGADAVSDPLALYQILSALCLAGRTGAAYALYKQFDGRGDAYGPYCDEWAASYLAGVGPAEAGCRSINVTPYVCDPPGIFTYEYQSLSGVICVTWNRTENGFELTVTVPPNTSATVSVPGHTLTRGERQKPVTSAECKPGTYTFTVI